MNQPQPGIPGAQPGTPAERRLIFPSARTGILAGSNSEVLAGLRDSLSLSSAQCLPTVREAVAKAPLTARASEHIAIFRRDIESILTGKDSRLLVIAGPCSLHDLQAATTFAERFAELQREVSSSMLLVMRGMFEKPRSSVGWKGFVHQPDVTGAPDMAGAITQLRTFFASCADLGVPMAAEALDPALQLYFIDALSYLTIGARTTESQVHRQMASLFKLPVGFKNPTSGDLKIAVDSIHAAASPQPAVLADPDGCPLQVMSNGNSLAHIVLRGGLNRSNYSPHDISAAQAEISERSRITGLSLLDAIVVDCSHGNSERDYLRQPLVFQHCIERLCDPTETRVRSLRGLMLEANLEPGKQLLKAGPLDPKVSVTDACIGFETLRAVLLSAHESLTARN